MDYYKALSTDSGTLECFIHICLYKKGLGIIRMAQIDQHEIE